MSYDERQVADAEWLACRVRIVELQGDLEQACEDRDTAASEVLMYEELVAEVDDFVAHALLAAEHDREYAASADFVERATALLDRIHNLI